MKTKNGSTGIGPSPSHKLDVRGTAVMPKVKFIERGLMKIIRWYLYKKHYSFTITKGWSQKNTTPNKRLTIITNGRVGIGS